MADLNWYRNFLAVYRLGSVSGAAKARNLTQPAVSQQLAALEGSVGEPLFVRSHKGMVPTERGRALYSEVSHQIDQLEYVAQGFSRSSHTSTRVFRLGTSPEYFYEVILPRLTTQLQPMRVCFDEAKVLLEQLEDGLLDAVIATPYSLKKGVEHQPLSQKFFYLVGPPALEVPLNFTLEWLHKQRWVAYSGDLPLVSQLLRLYGARDLRPSPALTVPDLRSVARAVEAGLGISVLPDFLAEPRARLGRVALLSEALNLSKETWHMSYRENDVRRFGLEALISRLRHLD